MAEGEPSQQEPLVENDSEPLCELVVERLKAPPLLLVGSLGMGVAICSIFVLAWVFFYHRQSEEYMFRYASGEGYLPSTFAELTWRRSDVTGRIFIACGLMSALMMQTSWYSYLLINVFTGNQCLIGTKLKWVTIRQIVPIAGLLLMAGVSSSPKAVWIRSPGFCMFAGVLLHSAGAWAVFVSYTAAELQCLGCLSCMTQQPVLDDLGQSSDGTTGIRHLQKEAYKAERRSRLFCISISAFCALCFIICQTILFVEKMGCPGLWHDDADRYADNTVVGGHCDEWAFPREWITIEKSSNVGSVAANSSDDFVRQPDMRYVRVEDYAEVVNTAQGPIVWIKACSLCLEFVGLIAFCWSHFLIWYWCEERQYEKAVSIPSHTE